MVEDIRSNNMFHRFWRNLNGKKHKPPTEQTDPNSQSSTSTHEPYEFLDAISSLSSLSASLSSIDQYDGESNKRGEDDIKQKRRASRPPGNILAFKHSQTPDSNSFTRPKPSSATSLDTMLMVGEKPITNTHRQSPRTPSIPYKARLPRQAGWRVRRTDTTPQGSPGISDCMSLV